jgi:hypothetical protein
MERARSVSGAALQEQQLASQAAARVGGYYVGKTLLTASSNWQEV